MCNSHESHGHESGGEPATHEHDSEPGVRAYSVKGMTCDHCAASVTEEVEQVKGVTGVDVDLHAGRVAVRGDGFSDEAIRAAVDEAGYEVATA